jgi:hypothetical protein
MHYSEKCFGDKINSQNLVENQKVSNCKANTVWINYKDKFIRKQK